MIRLIFATVLLFSLPAFAEESARYAPDHCGFEITFPEASSSARQCDGADQSKCYDLVSYTKTFDMDASVRVKVICNPVGDDIYKRYSTDVMEATLKAMTNKKIVETFEMNSRDEGSYKQSSLIGAGQQGTESTLYIAQLWIDRKSAFSVEAELLGSQNEEAEQFFSQILQSVHLKSDSPTKDEETSTEKDNEENSEDQAE
jgi:hypothetical protein